MLNYYLGTIEASEALIKDLYIDLRKKVNAWSEITQQTPQARMGYIGQHLVSVVTGYHGGKSGARGYDLLMGNGEYGEIKTCYRVDQLGTCNNCGKVVSSLEVNCAYCGSANISIKDDSKWLLSIRNDDEFAGILNPKRYYFVLFEFSDIADQNNNDIDAKIWEVNPNCKGFAYCMIDYYLNIRAHSKSKAPFNMWPYQVKFYLTKPKLIYYSKIHTDGKIDTIIFPTMGNEYDDELCDLPQYSMATTITVDAVNRIIQRISGDPSNVNKRTGLRILQDYRDSGELSNCDLCDWLAEEIYLPKILGQKANIPENIKNKFNDLT